MKFRVKSGWLRFTAEDEADRRALFRLSTALNGEAVHDYYHVAGELTIKLMPGWLAELRQKMDGVSVR